MLSSNCFDLFGYGNSITKHQVMNRTLEDNINGISKKVEVAEFYHALLLTKKS